MGLSETYPCNGGAFFWVVNDDPGGAWSKPVQSQLSSASGLCSKNPDSPGPPIPEPVPAPISVPLTAAPVPVTSAPIPVPLTAAPVPVTSAPIPVPLTAAPVPAPTGGSGGEIYCPSGFNGFKAYGDCTKYYQCANGRDYGLQNCPSGLLFKIIVVSVIGVTTSIVIPAVVVF